MRSSVLDDRARVRWEAGSQVINAWGDEVSAGVDTDVECTLPDTFGPVLSALDRCTFDTDPCTNPHALVPALVRHCLPTDGLLAPWYGDVWCNPPYSDPAPWVERCMLHGRFAALLITNDTSTAMWRTMIWPTAQLVLFFYRRLKFYNPAYPDRTTTAKRGSALVIWNAGAMRGDLVPLVRLGHIEQLR